jgi:hypothetical protein
MFAMTSANGRGFHLIHLRLECLKLEQSFLVEHFVNIDSIFLVEYSRHL